MNSDELSHITEKLDMLIRPKPFIERVGSILSSWSQVLMLAVVIYGYVYTVIPVFQKEKISEELAKLEIEKASWSDKLDAIKEQLKEKEKSLASIELLEESLSNELRSLSIERNKTFLALSQKEQEYTEAQAALTKANKTVDIAINDLLEQQKRTLLGKDPLPSNFFAALNYDVNNWDMFSSEKASQISESLEKSYPTPYQNADNILSKLDDVRNSSSGIDKLAKDRLYNDYKKGLEQSSHLLMCSKPNFEEWEANFIKLYKSHDYFDSLCAQKGIESQAAKEGWSEEQIENWKENGSFQDLTKHYKANCKISFEYHLGTIFREAWEDTVKPCRQRVLQVNSIVFGELQGDELEPFSDMSPPSQALVEHKLKESDYN
jgi:hypothetical protein